MQTRELAFCALLVLGFQSSAEEERYRVVRIDPPPGESAHLIHGLDLNLAGDVVGNYFAHEQFNGRVQNRIRAFLYSDAFGTREILLEGYRGTSATGINNEGQIAVSTSDDGGVWRDAFRYTPGVGFEPLGNLGGVESETKGINSGGQVIGYSELPDCAGFPYRYTDGTGMELLAGISDQPGTAFDINDGGWVTGSSAGRAFIYRDDFEVVILGPGRGYGINNQGTVVGEVILPQGSSFSDTEAFVYQQGRMLHLGQWGARFGHGSTVAYDVNNFDVAVGSAYAFDESPLSPSSVALVWTEREGMQDLNTFISRQSGWFLQAARAINDRGQMTGEGSLGGAEAVTFRLDPIPPKLSIQHSPADLLLSWSPNWPGVVLETTESLAAPNWEPVDTASTNVVHLPMTDASRFFRLNLEALRGLCCPPEE
jgi:probable HAF family extracellular repeat protein